MNTTQVKKAVVTGGAGFIGSHLSQELLNRGYTVIVVDDLSTGSLLNFEAFEYHKSFQFVEGSILEKSLLTGLFENATYVFHQAAVPSVPRSIETPDITHAANVTGTLNVLMAARDAGVEKVVYASSSSVYGDTPTLPKHEEMLPCPLSPYAVSKLAGEYYCTAFNASYGLKTVCLRYFNVYGPRQAADSAYAAVIPKFIKSLKQGQAPLIFGTGIQTRDFTFVKDVVNANILAAESNASGVFNVCANSKVTINELAHQLATILKTPHIKPRYEEPRPGDVLHSLGDYTLAKNAFGYQPQYLLTQGLELTV